jgi:CRP-like cAMP-binding protein
MDDYKYLSNYPIFRDLTDEELKQVHSIIRFKSFDKGMKIFEEGEEGEEMYVLLEGEIEITKPLTLLSNQTGNTNRDDMALIRLKTEDHACVGEMALFGDDDVRSATITAQRPSKFGVINKDDFLNLMEENHTLGFKVMRNLAQIMGERLKKANQDILKLTTAFTLALEE